MGKLPVPEISELKKLHIFKRISDLELSQIREVMERRLYRQDEFIIKEDEPGDMFYVLLKGSVYVVKRIEGNRQEVLNLIDQPGDLFGEMSLVEDKPRSAGVVTTENCEVLTIGKEHFLGLVNRFPRFTLEVARNISNYLRSTDQKLIDVLKEKNSELSEAYRKLEETQEELIRQERLSLVGRMAATILHDIKNPMSAISGYAQLIKTGRYPHEKLAKFADIINREVSRLSNLAQELLSFAKGEGLVKQKHVNLNQFLKELIESMAYKFEDKGITVSTEFGYDGDVYIDASRMRRAIENIANNSIEAIKSGGKFTIETSPTDSGVKIYLADTGHGMTDDVRKKIFKEFYTYGKSTGTGLGLAITKRIVDDHGGKIEVESELGEGTKFFIELPRSY